MAKIKEEIQNKKSEKTFKEKYESGLITRGGLDISELNQKELTYFRMMLPKSGVLFLTSAPGLAKSAMQRSIAKKIKKVELITNANNVVDVEKSGKVIAKEMFYIDLRLAMLDETDVGLFPDKKEIKVIEETGEEIIKAFLDHIVPKWAYLSNNPPAKKDKTDMLPYAGTIIHFEELNRAPLAVRNAALQILLERCIGFEFEFNDNVLMVSTGNLGEEDGTDVEEFDSALNGRLIHIEHTLNLEEWINMYANTHINNIIVRFLTAHPDMYYVGKKSRDEKDKSYASPRTWTFLSDYITENYGFNANPQMWVNDIPNIGHGYIGAACNTKFMRYVRDVLKISIKDIINRYPQLQKEGVVFTRDKKSELLGDLRTQTFAKFTKDQLENVKLFMLDLSEDEISAFLIKLIDEDYDYEEDESLDEKKNNFILDFLRDKRFKKYNAIMLGYVKNKDDKDEDEENKEKEGKKGFWS